MLNRKLQDELEEMLETGWIKEISSGYTPTNSSALNNISDMSSLIRTVSSLSTSAILSNVVLSNESKSLNGIGCTEQDDSAEQLRSSPSDVSPLHFLQVQLSGTLSSQGLSSVPAFPSKESCFLQYGRPLLLDSFPHARQELDIQETYITGEPEEFASEASAIDQNSSLRVSNSDKSIVVTQGSHITSLVEPSSSCYLVSSTDPRENFADVKQGATHTIDSDMHKLEAQVCELYEMSTQQQQTSPHHTVETHISFATEAGDVENVSLASMVVNSEKEIGIQSILSSSSRSSCQILSPLKELKEIGPGLNCQATPGSHHLTNEMNREQCLPESQASSMSSHFGECEITNLESFSKLLSTIKKLANQQRRYMGVGMAFPCVFESFRSSICQMEKYAQSLPSTSDGHMPFGKLSTTESLVTSWCPESYGPCTVNIHQLAPTEELTMQGPLFQQGISEKVVTNGFPMLPSSSQALPLQKNNLPTQEFGSSSSTALKGQAQETCLMPKICSNLLHSIVHPFDQELAKALQVMLKQNNEANIAVTSGPSLKIETNQQVVHSHNCPGQTKVVDTNGPAQWQAFSMGDTEVIPLSSCPQGIKGEGEEIPSRGFIGGVPIELQKQDYNDISNELLLSSLGVNDKSKIIPHFPDMVVSQLETVVNDNVLALQVAATYKSMVSSGISPAIASQQNFPRESIQCLSQGAPLVPVNTSSNTDVAFKECELRVSETNSKFASFSSNKNECIQQNSSSMTNVGPLVTVLPKKRKRVVMPILRVIEPGGGIPTISASELAWAAVTNRLVEKDESDDIFDEKAGSISQAKRRLKLTSQLTQQLVPPLPSAMMCSKTIVELEDLIYTLAKMVLINACELGYKFGIYGDHQKFKRLRSNYVQRVEESYMGRVKDLENELQRLNASSYMSDLRSDSQDLDRLLITNRLAKHHVINFTVGYKKAIKDGKESSSDCGLFIRKMCPHRYVTAVPMPKDIPEGFLCYSL